MELKNYIINKRIDINELVSTLIISSKKEQNDIILKILVNSDCIDYTYGILSRELLLGLLCKRRKNKNIDKILPSILYRVNVDTIDNIIFEMIINLPHKIRDNCLISLAHCSLSMYQLLYIDSLNICTEAFAQLLNCIITNDLFSCYDLKKLFDYRKSCPRKLVNRKIIVQSILDDEELIISEAKLKILKEYVAND